MSTLSTRRHRSLTLAAAASAGALGLAVAGLFAPPLAAHTPGSGGSETHASGLGRTARRLGLSDDQKQQIRGILKSHATEIETQLAAAQTGRKALREAMGTQPLDEGRIRQQALALGEVRADGAVLRARIRSEIWPVLTAEQQEKAKQLRSMKGKREKRRIDALARWLQNG
ncbi:MAG: Spy/CpxP family protein refolding chaperone [Thermoanaerobaculia bacterium]